MSVDLPLTQETVAALEKVALSAWLEKYPGSTRQPALREWLDEPTHVVWFVGMKPDEMYAFGARNSIPDTTLIVALEWLKNFLEIQVTLHASGRAQ